MKLVIKWINLGAIVLLLLPGCDKVDLSDTVIGMKLGGDFDQQLKIANGCSVCDHDPFLSYKIFDDHPYGSVFGYPKLSYCYNEDKKILSNVEVAYTDPANVPIIGGMLYPALDYRQVLKLKDLFELKYGEGRGKCSNERGELQWEQGDMDVSFKYFPVTYSRLPDTYRSLFFGKLGVRVKYKFNSKTQKLLNYKKGNYKRDNTDVI